MTAHAAGDLTPDFRCWRCGKLLAEIAGPGTEIRCSRCGARSRTAADGEPPPDPPKRDRARRKSATA